MPALKKYCFNDNNYSDTSFQSDWIYLADESYMTLSILTDSNADLNFYYSIDNNHEIIKTESFTITGGTFFTVNRPVITRYFQFELTSLTNPCILNIQLFYHS